MQKETEEKFRDFISRETWYTANQTDRDKFYQFIVEAYKNGDTDVSFDEFFRFIKEIQKNGDNFEEQARDHYSKYETGIEILKIYSIKKI